MSLLDKIKKDVSEEEIQTVDQQATENLTKEERKALKKAKRTGFTETIKDDYDDSDRTLADSDAHRDVVYTPPSTIRQIGICYMTQMPNEFMYDVEHMQGVSALERTGERSVKFKFIGSDEQQADIVDMVYRHKLRLLSMNESGADLESLYMQLTEEDEVNVK